MKRCDEGANLEIMTHEDAIELSEFYKMVGDSNRIRLLYLLIDKEICVHHLAEQLGMSQSAVSHQLRLLRQQRLVKYTKDGKKIYYSLDDEHVKTILNIGLEHLKHREE
ncbi:MAG: metalloregulator ArsR/SmtB family transcription factor [Eubacteriales bacterium]